VRIHVACTPAALADASLAGTTALVIDVLRASTSIITALAHGCAGVVPVREPDEAIRRAAAEPGALVAGERHGDPLEGFDLGNSPLEFTRERVGGRTVYLTTSNGTGALLAVRGAAAIGVAAFINTGAAAMWALAAGRDLVIVCAGDVGRRSLEDEVCAGLIVEQVRAARPDAVLGPEAGEVAGQARPYAKDLGRLAQDSPWARRLGNRGRGADLTTCLCLDTVGLVPIYRPNLDRIVAAPGL
jgi:2-phosphosulfolactate phosphatase